jgi:hypothetical protein
MAAMRTGPGVVRLLVLAAFVGGAGAPLACSSAFSAGGADGGSPPGDGGPGTDVDIGVGPGDGSSPADAQGEGHADATGPGDAATSDVTAVEGGVTVAGKVLDGLFLPMSGIAVHCQGRTALTAADGSFTLSGITTPYTATVVVPQGGVRNHGYVFEGVTRIDPTLQLAAEHGPGQTSALSGNLTTNSATSAGIVFADFPAGTPALTSPTIPIAYEADMFMGNLSWAGGPSASATLYALQWNTVDGLPVSFFDYGSSAQTLTGGAAHPWNPPAATPSSASMTVTVTETTGYFTHDIAVYVRPAGARVAAPLQHGLAIDTTTQTAVTPALAGATFVACGQQVLDAFDGGANAAFGYVCATNLSASDSPTLTPPPATTFTSAPATATAGTVFAYQGIPSGIYMVVFAPAASAAGSTDSLYVITAAPQAAIPDLSALGFALPHGASLTAEAYGVAPFANIDAALGPTGYAERLTDYNLDTGPSVDGSLAYSGQAAFTLQ